MTPKTSLELFSDIMVGKIQKELSLKLKKIYPLALCEIRILEIVNKKQ
jgi:ribosomal protein S3AE